MKHQRFLIINADDFGFTRDVNAGIVDGHHRGILTSATLMANGDAFADAVRLARANPTLDIGCHLVLVGGRSLLSPYERLPLSIADLVRALCRRQLRVYDELAAQVRRILDAGIAPTHLDTHKHTHVLPPVLDAVARISEEFRIPWVRRPFDLPLNGADVPWSRRATNNALGLLRRRVQRVLELRGCRTTDNFAGFQITGRFRSAELIRLIRGLPPGTTEFMCHPGHCTDELRAARTRLKESRGRELAALVDPEVRAALTDAGVALRSFGDL